MDIYQLRNFLAVVQARNITKAAQVLRIAQPAVGLQIRSLEQDLGTKLLIRHARGVTPTEAGHHLARQAKALISQFEIVRQEVADFGVRPRGTVVFGISNTAAQPLTATMIQRCRRKYPDVNLVVIDGRGSSLINQIAEERLDLALTKFPTTRPEVISIPILREELLIVRGPGRQKLKPYLSLEEICALTLLLPTDERHPVRQLIERAAQKTETRLALYCAIESVPLVKELVRCGVAAAVLPFGTVKKEITSRELRAQRVRAEGFTQVLHLTHSSRRPISKAVQAVIAEVRATANQLANNSGYGWKAIERRSAS